MLNIFQFLSCRGPRTEDEADAALKMPTLPPSLSPSKKSSSLDNKSKMSISSNEKKVNHNGEWLGGGEKASTRLRDAAFWFPQASLCILDEYRDSRLQ